MSGLDILIIRELTGDIYFGTPRGERARLTALSPASARATPCATPNPKCAASRASASNPPASAAKLCSVDKANVLETSQFWRDLVIEVARVSDVELSHMYVDNAAMQLVRNPRQFDVIVTGNLFGDILSDEAAMLTGSIGMLPSASLNAGGQGLYEPSHGSAPDIAGQGIANPLATILSAAMMLRYSLNLAPQADRIEAAVRRVLADGLRTADIYEPGTTKVGTAGMGDAVLKARHARLPAGMPCLPRRRMPGGRRFAANLAAPFSAPPDENAPQAPARMPAAWRAGHYSSCAATYPRAF